MAENKTQITEVRAEDFLMTIENEQRRHDGFNLMKMMKDLTGLKPKMWGPAIVGFGSYHYKYDSGREGDAPMIGFSPRKQNMVLYIAKGPDYPELISKLGKHKTGVVCLYLNKLEDADQEILSRMIVSGYKYMIQKYG